MTIMNALEAIAGRRSVRAFLPDPVSKDTIHEILRTSSRAPSGTNIQPWLVHVVMGQARDRVVRAGIEAAGTGAVSPEYDYLPKDMQEPWLSRRRAIGYALFEKYGIARDDYPAREAAMLRNYDFFGAPVGLFFCMDRAHALGAWLDCGMFMQNVMIAARDFGLETCPQQAWCDIGPVVHRELGIADTQIVLSGMAMGYEDTSAAVNSLESPRIGVDEFATWHG
ncbi:MAG: nitroreductase [Novosphingobium sp.]|nr:nitroreductase [Novosphingobium sp.]MCP5400875.1 nitroreductase [Novosphingobium sp.]